MVNGEVKDRRKSIMKHKKIRTWLSSESLSRYGAATQKTAIFILAAVTA
jgi:hypothetical protein